MEIKAVAAQLKGQYMYETMNYFQALSLAQKTVFNVNHAGWIIYEDSLVKYTLDTLNNGLSFRIGEWEPGKNVGKIVKEIAAPPEIEFLLYLNSDTNYEELDNEEG